jgi:methanogenic corrinoid protein MtbC1
MSMKEEMLAKLAKSVVDQDKELASALSQEALEAGILASEAIAQGLSSGMREMGRLWNCMEIFMPEVAAATDAYYAGLKVLTPALALEQVGKEPVATAVFGTIWGDIHSVGKDVVIPVFQAEGFNVVDLGVDVSVDKYIAAVKEHKAIVVGVGTYMGETFAHVSAVVDEFAAKGLRDNLIIVCGGPAADDRHAQDMGANGGFNDAWVAVAAVKKMVEARKQPDVKA